MISKLTSQKVIDFIKTHCNQAPSKIALLAKKHVDLPILEICNQIECRQKAKNKLPCWTENFELIFPPKISWEQCSSEQTATFKSTILKGKTLLDLTGGFGIDTYFLSLSFDKVVHLEQNTELQKIALHNFKSLKANNIDSINADSLDFLNETTQTFDCIYIDPARRDHKNKKIKSLTECTPNVIENLDLILQKSDTLVIKTSPLLDIKQAINELQFVNQIFVISVKNECKEVLYLLNNIKTENPLITCVNLETQQNSFTFNYENERDAESELDIPQNYLYEPNSAILKAGAFKSIANQFNLKKLHPNTHLYTSNILIDFPGKVFKINNVCSYNKKEILSKIPLKKTNIATRNFIDKPDDVAKKLGIKTGGKNMLFACTTNNNKLSILLCTNASAINI